MILGPDDVKGDVSRSADVVIIGSGAGGGPIARELAGEDHTVVVIEEGGYFTRDVFNINPTEAYIKMYRDAGQTITVGVPSSCCPWARRWAAPPP